MRKRRAAGADVLREYLETARNRIELALLGKLPIRPMDRPVYQPDVRTAIARRPPELGHPKLLQEQ